MTRRRIIVGVIASAVFAVAIFSFGAFMVSKAQTWSAEHRILSVPVQAAVNAGSFIQSHPVFVLLTVIGLCFSFVWLAGKIFSKDEAVA